jgi:hypothetical protein
MVEPQKVSVLLHFSFKFMWLLTQIEPLVTRAVWLITQGFIYRTSSLEMKKVK